MRFFIFATLALLLVVGSYFSECLCPYDPYEQNLSIAKASPSLAHPFGTDRYGRDMLSRVIVGSKTSIYSTLLLVVGITVIGTIVGIICGWNGKKLIHQQAVCRLGILFCRLACQCGHDQRGRVKISHIVLENDCGTIPALL